eukprot:TRINITY_DN6413_c0_g1_i5.p1 TRINITY_DN6413_c0_g1~~TRINITY_DN6413_c0_g1_i5.p1  ORF type:complete len:759 (+),score=99.48 TRINITY_DN6413_c0_g1_i5:94-2277(+)
MVAFVVSINAPAVAATDTNTCDASAVVAADNLLQAGLKRSTEHDAMLSDDPTISGEHGRAFEDEDGEYEDEDEEDAEHYISLLDALSDSESCWLTNCEVEQQIKDALSAFYETKGGRHRAPTFVRAAFHDAIDENNLLLKNGETWEHVPGDYGGLDLCLWSPLSKGTSGHHSGTHNWNTEKAIRRLERFVQPALRHGLCNSWNDCQVDILALGAIVAIGKAGGPWLEMEWGRKKGDCKFILPGGASSYGAALRDAPAFADMTADFRGTFQSMGFDAREQAALMGAHSFGKVQPNACLGNFQDAHKGRMCNQPEQLIPTVTDDMLVEKGCVPVEGKHGCWKQAKDSSNKTRLYPYYKSSDDAHMSMHHGLYWDRTPDVFDNDYFKLFAGEDFSGKDVCCGKKKRYGNWAGCSIDGMPSKRTTNKQIPGGLCSVSWCRDDRWWKTHMKSTKAWAEVNHEFVCTNRYCAPWNGAQRRMIRLAGDWGLLGHSETKSVVQEFAENQTAFFVEFERAFAKVLRKGHVPLKTCAVRDATTPETTPSQLSATIWRDTAHDGMKCGDYGSADRVFDLRGGDATEEACKQTCNDMQECVAFSGVPGSWCVGCRISLDKSFDDGCTKAYTKASSISPTTASTTAEATAETTSVMSTTTLEVDATVAVERDSARDGKKCGNYGSADRVFDLRRGAATEEACKQKCTDMDECVAFSGVFGSWCVGCRIPLDRRGLQTEMH